MIDSGIWPDSQSFADPRRRTASAYGPVDGFTGTCDQSSPDDSWNAALCNGKLVGARHFNDGWGGDAGHRRSHAVGVPVAA